MSVCSATKICIRRVPCPGSTFHGARLSGAFHVRSFALTEYHPRNISFALSADNANKEPAKRPLFINSKYPSKKLVTVFRKQNFNVTLYEAATDPTRCPLHSKGVLVAVAFVWFALRGAISATAFGRDVHCVHTFA